MRVGYKPAGGISKAKDAITYLALMKEELGDRWLQPDLFRFGASSLLGDIERQYYSALSQLWDRWTGGMGGTFAYRASGASIAIRTAIYEAVGRLPLPTHGEDAALCARVIERGYHVAQVSDLGTRTSARLDGRAAGGCGQALQHRSVAADPFCDAALLSIPVLRKRAATGKNRDGCDGAAPLRLSEVERELAIARRLLLEGEREVA